MNDTSEFWVTFLSRNHSESNAKSCSIPRVAISKLMMLHFGVVTSENLKISMLISILITENNNWSNQY